MAYVSMMSHIKPWSSAVSTRLAPRWWSPTKATSHNQSAAISLRRQDHQMWRKLGCWFWIATQNLGDFPDESRRMLNMIEWWLCLCLPEEEIAQMARFRHLSQEQRAMLRSARKSPGQYVEGVVLADKVEALFRNVPPPISLALAMTEKDEKAQRAELMKQHNCSELEAAHRVAELLEKGAA